MQQFSDDRVAHLTEELERMRRELVQLQQAHPSGRSSGLLRSARLVTATPLLLLGAWVLSAGAPATQDDLEQRVSELETRLSKGPGATTRIQAPFEVVGPGGNVILQVTQGDPTVSNGVGIFTRGQDGGVLVSRGGHDVAGIGTAEDGDGGQLFISDRYGIPKSEVNAGYINVLNDGGKVVASMLAQDSAQQDGRFLIVRGEHVLASLEGDDDGGRMTVTDEKGKSVVQLGAVDGNGFVATLDHKGRAEVEMGVSEGGEPQLAVSKKGKVRASLGLSSGAGHLSVSNTKNSIVANVTGTGTNGGAVIVGNGSGKSVASLKAGADGSGLVQIFEPGGPAVAVLAQDGSGGQLQIKNTSGIAVANLKAAKGGGGYWELNDPGGNPVVEGGFDGSRGIVRAGPNYKCSAAMQTAVVVGVASLPDCIQGSSK